MNTQPIFLHGLWRAGTTYCWSKFRNVSNTYCFYEPLHHGLAKLTPSRIERELYTTYKDNAHPDLDKPYFYEFLPVLNSGVFGKRGVKHFKKSFAYDRFYLSENDTHKELENYIYSLVDFAASEHVLQRAENEKTDLLAKDAPENIRPVLGFNRTVLRLGWIKKKFPDTCHIFIERNPQDIWSSYQRHHLEGNHTYFMAWLRIILRNQNHPAFLESFKLLKGAIDKTEKKSISANISPYMVFAQLRKHSANNKKYLSSLLEALSEEQTQKMVSQMHKIAKEQAMQHADCIVDIDQLSDAEYKRSIEEEIMRKCSIKVDFSDAKPSASLRHSSTLDSIQGLVSSNL